MGFGSINYGFSSSSGGGGGGTITGGGTLNRIVKFSGATAIGDSEWEAIGNDIIPITTASNIGSATKRIATIYMASTFDYASTLNWYNGTSNTMTLLTTGELGVGIALPTAKIHVVSSGVDATTDALKVYSNSGSALSLRVYDNTSVETGRALGIGVSPNSAYRLYTIGAVGSSILGYFEASGTYAYSGQALGIHDNGNVAVGSLVVSSANSKFTVTGDSSMPNAVSVKGGGSTSVTYSLKIDNASTNPLLYVRDDGSVYSHGAGFVVTNTAFGLDALIANTTGSVNTAFGEKSAFSNTTGTYVSAFGRFAMYSNTIGVANTGIGSESLFSNTTGNYNTAVGMQSMSGVGMTGSFNVSVGYQSSYSITNGYSNTALGYLAMRNSTTARENVAIGQSALTANLDGIQNVAIGVGAMGSGNTGNYNNCIGLQAGQDITGNANQAMGYRALWANTSGNTNVAIGSSALYNNVSGSSNVALGNSAGYYETGSNKLFIDNAERLSEADGRIKALVYGEFGATAQAQRLTVNAPIRSHNFSATDASLITPLDGDMIYVNSTNGTFTSVGFWGYENGVWIKL